MTANGIKLHRAVFLDRDGTISPDEFGYIDHPEGYSLYPYTGEALRFLRDCGFYLFIVTNQSGIARGYFTPEQLERVHKRMLELIRAEGADVDAIYYSPYFKTGIVEPYNIDHEDRKPGIGLYKKARKQFSFRPEQSWVIGDRYTDIIFGKNAGLKTVLLLTGNGRKEFYEDMPDWDIKPDFVAEDLLAAAFLISEHYCR